jgi:hypothetical protein
MCRDAGRRGFQTFFWVDTVVMGEFHHEIGVGDQDMKNDEITGWK